jgi:FKBP-type peptidyl-prolyl cis-trans isomerase
MAMKKKGVSIGMIDDNASEEEAIQMTEQEKLERVEDDRNITIEIKAYGDGENYPIVGDIVRVRYTCSVLNGKTILSTKNSLDRPMGIEFVLGCNQVIKGIDRALLRMTLGEKSRITIKPEYAYGEQGLFPHIAPGTTLVFDLTLLEFRQRPTWVKPLMQEPGLSQKPYMNVIHAMNASSISSV